MKNCLAIFFLLLLPLQFSWAAVAGYCQHETGVAAKHLGHHDHDHPSAETPEPDPHPPAGLHHDCATCHLGCATPLAGELSTPKTANAQSHVSDYLVNASRAHTERPERPKWLGLA